LQPRWNTEILRYAQDEGFQKGAALKDEGFQEGAALKDEGGGGAKVVVGMCLG